MSQNVLMRLWHRLAGIIDPSGPGSLLGAIFFAFAMTPSLIPRTGLIQGVLGGAAFSLGYFVGALLVMVWQVLQLREPAPARQVTYRNLLVTAAFVIMLWALSQATGWQDDLHEVMGLPQVESARPFTIAGVALALTTILVLVGRLFRRAVIWVAARLAPLMPERLALLTGFVIACLGFMTVANDVLITRILSFMDATYEKVDKVQPPDQQPPTDPLRSGSAASLLDWSDLGAEGRRRILDPLDQATIEAITQEPAQEPLRIYVGLSSAETPEARADLALREALRTGAFERGTLVIATPTGTGWIDAASTLPLEVMTGCDVATISVQYSYLPSWLALLTVPEYGRATARATFAAIHGYWKTLPVQTRPKFYLNGLSLGAMNSDLSADFFDLIGDPYDGAFWIGPPFPSRTWNTVTNDRLPQTPAWLPRFRDGSTVRFMNQFDMPDADKPWGAVRVLYLQHANDPITFFSPWIAWQRPQWLNHPRGPGIPDSLGWIPLVTFLQVGFDVMTATLTPKGWGHVFAARDYMRGWEAILSPTNWTEEKRQRLLTEIDARGL